MKRAILSLGLALAFVAGLAAQDKPNFAGKWKPAGSFNTYTITVDGSKMTVTLMIAGNADPTVYMLDGTPAKKTIEGPLGPVETVRTSTWDGSVLVTTAQMSNGSANVERRWLEPDGTMKVQITFTMMQGKPAPPAPPGAGQQVLKKVG